MTDYRKHMPDRECKVLWTINFHRAIQVQGFSCGPNNPNLWWCPEIGYSISDEHHVYQDEKSALEAVLAEICKEMRELDDKRSDAIKRLLTLNAP